MRRVNVGRGNFVEGSLGMTLRFVHLHDVLREQVRYISCYKDMHVQTAVRRSPGMRRHTGDILDGIRYPCNEPPSARGTGKRGGMSNSTRRGALRTCAVG